jgi:histidinol-phosphate aminotransferase
MMNPQDFLRQHIRKMESYIPILPFDVISDELGIPEDQIVKLDANENPYGPIPAVSDALAKLPYTHIYPDPESRKLRQSIAAYNDVSFENILAGAGADELIDLIMRLLLDPGDCILNCPPTFGMYQFDADVNAANVITIPRKKDFNIDIDGIVTSIQQHRPKVLFLASPNNPDGSLLSENDLNTLLDLPIILVLDEAYIDFASPAMSRVNLVAENENLVVIRTFSKWPGLAGLRVGYGVFPNWMMPHLWKIKQPYNVSVAGSTAAIVSLEHIEQLELRTNLMITERERLFQLLQTIPWIEPYPSKANFILCKITDFDAAEVKDNLGRQGILIRYFDKPGLSDHIRVSIGKPEHSDRLISSLREF